MNNWEIRFMKALVVAIVIGVAVVSLTGCTVVSTDDPSWTWPTDLEVYGDES